MTGKKQKIIYKKQNNLDLKFIADKVSGLPGDLHLLSIFIKILEVSNCRHFIKFHFYGLNIDCNKKYADEYIDQLKYEAETDKLLTYIRKKGTKYLEDTAILISQEAKDFKKYSEQILNKISKLNTRQLIDCISQYRDFYSHCYGLGVITFAYEDILSDRLSKSLFVRYQNTPRIISQLLDNGYKSFMLDSEELLLKIKQAKNKNQSAVLIKRYLQDFYFMGPAYIYTKALDARGVHKLAFSTKAFKYQKADKISPFKLLPEEKLIIDILKSTEIIRDKRKYISQIGSYTLCRFLEEAVKRSNIPMSLAVKSFWFEYADLILSPQLIKSKLKNRNKVSLLAVDNNLMYLEGDRISDKRVISKHQKYFSGTPACNGKVSGRARIILGPSDFQKFENGEILVTDMTRPDFLPIIRHAKAIITNEGGLTSHAAIISRELAIPCILGTKVATRVLKDGDLVEVDADKGIIKRLKKK